MFQVEFDPPSTMNTNETTSLKIGKLIASSAGKSSWP